MPALPPPCPGLGNQESELGASRSLEKRPCGAEVQIWEKGELLGKHWGRNALRLLLQSLEKPQTGFNCCCK